MPEVPSPSVVDVFGSTAGVGAFLSVVVLVASSS
jgi:hypothetical protein